MNNKKEQEPNLPTDDTVKKFFETMDEMFKPLSKKVPDGKDKMPIKDEIPMSAASKKCMRADLDFANAVEALKKFQQGLTTPQDVDNLTSKVLKLCK